MELKRISGQQKRTLLEFYDPKEWPSQWKKMPEMMCGLIKSLESIDHEPIWVSLLTQNYYLRTKMATKIGRF